MTAAFYLNNREAKRELKFFNNNRLLPFCLTPTYLEIKLNRLLTTLSLAYRGSLYPDQILYGLLSESSDARKEKLKSCWCL